MCLATVTKPKNGPAVSLSAAFITILCMPKKRKRNNPADKNELSLEDYMERLPPPPPEHVQELVMEKIVKQMVEANQKKY